MKDFDIYKEQFLTFNNPFFIAVITFVIIILIIIFVFIKMILPLQKRMVSENQRFLLEKAQLMALFAEMDPDPLIRINNNGEIIHTNESSRNLFSHYDLSNSTIDKLIPSFNNLLNDNVINSIQSIGEKIFSVSIKREEKIGFTNIYLHDITKIKKYEYELESYKNNLLKLSNELDKKYEDLKKTLSAELHDDLGQKMIILKLKVANAKKYQSSEILSDIESIYQRIREMSKTLVPIEFNTLGLKLSLQSIIQNISQASGIKGQLQFSCDIDIDIDIDICIIHFVQEALNNVVKHSQASEFLVTVTEDEKNKTVIVSDNGKGFPKEKTMNNIIEKNQNGLGILKIKERINKLGGTFSIESNSVYRTNLIAKIPIERDTYAAN